MRKRIIWLTALLLVVFGGDRLGSYILKTLTLKSQFRYSRLYNDTAQADILLLGNSRGLCFYQPHIEAITGKSTLNLSYNALPIDLAEVLLSDYLERYPPPELLVIDITICDRINESLITEFLCYSSFSERLQGLIHETDPLVSSAGQVTQLYRYNSEIFQRALYYLKKSDEEWLLDRVISEELIVRLDRDYSYRIRNPKSMIRHLRHLVVTAQKAGVAVKLVVNPYFPPFRERMEDLDQMVADVEAATGLPVDDFSTVIEEERAFGDYQHLNKYGAKRYVELLHENGFF